MGIVVPFKPRSALLRVSSAAGRRAALRDLVAEEIEHLIAVLDALDAEPDLEPGGDDEPSLGWLNSGGHSWRDGDIDLEVGHSPVEGA